MSQRLHESTADEQLRAFNHALHVGPQTQTADDVRWCEHIAELDNARRILRNINVAPRPHMRLTRTILSGAPTLHGTGRRWFAYAYSNILHAEARLDNAWQSLRDIKVAPRPHMRLFGVHNRRTPIFYTAGHQRILHHKRPTRELLLITVPALLRRFSAGY
jgi:hypothetical protein